MREFGKIKTTLWNSKRYRSITIPLSKVLYLYFHTNIHGNSIGCYWISKGYVRGDIALPETSIDDIDRAIEELSNLKLICWDDDEEIVYLCDFLKHSPLTNRKHAIGAAKAAVSLPSLPLKTRIFQDIKVAAALVNDKSSSPSVVEQVTQIFDRDTIGVYKHTDTPIDTGMHTTETETETKTITAASVNNSAREAVPEAGLDAVPEAKNAAADADSKPSGKEEAKTRIEVGNRVLQAAGIDPAKWIGDFSVVSMWLNSGFDVELDIVPTVERVRKRKDPSWSLSSLSYFTKAIADAHRERNIKLSAVPGRCDEAPPLVTKSLEDQLAEVRIPILVRKGYSAEEIVEMKSHEMTEDEFEAVQVKVAVA